MKKKVVSVLAAVLALGLLAGCSSKETTALKDLKVDKYVTVGEYKGMQVKVASATVDEAELKSVVDNAYFNNVTLENGGVTDRTVVVGDTVNIDYEGKKDGVAFDGGTAQNQLLTIGSGQFIDGFEDGLVGVMPGETVDLNLTFPENYHSADLAGQEVVFTVTVNFIMPTEKDDAVIAAMGIENVTNEEELVQYANDYLYASALETYNNNVKNVIMDQLIQNSTFKEIPEVLIEKYETATRENITNTAAMYGMDADTFTNTFYAMDMENFVTTYAEEAVKQDIALQWIANTENLNVTDEELDAKLLEEAQTYGLSTIDAYIGETPKEDFREYYMYEKVMNFLVENAVVTE